MIYSRRWNPSPITAEENTYLPARSVEDKPRAGCVHKHTEHPSLLQPVCGNFSDEIFVSGGASCGYCSTLSAPHPMSSCCSIQPLSLLAWLPATPESFQQTPLSASWIKQPPTSKTMAAFLLCVFMFHKDESRSFVRLRGMQIHANTAGLEGAEATLFTNDNKSVQLLIEYSTNDLLRGLMTFVSVAFCL